MKSMENAAYSLEYLATREKDCTDLFKAEHFEKEEIEELGGGLSIAVKRYSYSGFERYQYTVSGSINHVMRCGVQIYSYEVMNTRRKPTLITHQNGHEYLVFTRDLYGYSVLDLTDMQAYHYFPKSSFPEGETFIWCDAYYNPVNNMLLVDGCFWAGPYGVVLVDFTNPMAGNTQIDVRAMLDPEYEFFGHIDFAAWDGTDLVLLGDKEADGEERGKIVLKSEEYSVWMR